MKKISYKKLMVKVEDGDAVIRAYSLDQDNRWIVETYDREGRAKREEYEVSGIPAAVVKE